MDGAMLISAISTDPVWARALFVQWLPKQRLKLGVFALDRAHQRAIALAKIKRSFVFEDETFLIYFGLCRALGFQRLANIQRLGFQPAGFAFFYESLRVLFDVAEGVVVDRDGKAGS